MIELFLSIFVTGFISFLCTLSLVPVCKAIAIKTRFLDVPDGTIKIQKNPVPFLGGVAVYLGFLAGLFTILPVYGEILHLVGGASILLFIGLVDDFLPMKAYQKLIGQMVVAACFLTMGLYLKEDFFSHYWALPLSFLWIPTITNAFNLVDVMDGLATTLSLSSAFAFLFLAVSLNMCNIALVLSGFIGGLLAFLVYNYPPASIYLGDAGSLFVGGFLSAIPFLFVWGHDNPYGFLAVPLLFSLPLLELCSLIVIRTAKGIPFYRASPDHFSLYLLKKGWSKPAVLLYALATSLIASGIAILFVKNMIRFVGAAALLWAVLAQWFYIVLPKKQK